jgi:serine/threonine-protein kinase
LLPGINFGTVQSTDPAAGTQIPKGSTVTLKTV